MRVLWTVLIALFAAGVWAATVARTSARDSPATDQITSERAADPPSPADPLLEPSRNSDDDRDAATESPADPIARASGSGDSTQPVEAVDAVEMPAPPRAGEFDDPSASDAAPTATPASAPDPATFILRGRGTELDPFRATWDLLRSTERTFKPAQDLREIPPAVALLEGEIVSVTGYFAAGVAEESTRELLVMFNRWDGCCLGLPPSPFDSIEVKLREPVVLRGQHMIRYGTITGRFEIEPFLVADWLIGLYRLVDAKLEWGGGAG